MTCPGNGLLICEDADKLVQLRMKDGAPIIVFNLKRWNELHNIFNDERFKSYGNTEFRDGPFLIKNLTGAIKAACIGDIAEWLDGYGWRDYYKPTFVLLLEDGSLWYIHADPLNTSGEWFNASALQKVDDVKKLSYEKNGEVHTRPYVPIADENYKIQPGDIIEHKSIFAIAENGLKYDVGNLIQLNFLLHSSWICKYHPTFKNKTVNGILRLEYDGTARYDFGVGDYGIDEFHEIWHGTYRIAPVDKKKYPNPTILLDLKRMWNRDWWGYAMFEYPTAIKGAFEISQTSDWMMDLKLIDGDALFRDEETRKPRSSYSLEMYRLPWGVFSIWDMSCKELIDHVIAEVSEANELITQKGKTAIVPGNISEFDGLCRDVWIGSYSNGKFVRDIRYTVIQNSEGTVFQHFSSGDNDEYNEWAVVSTPKPRLMYLKFGKPLNDGWWEVQTCPVELDNTMAGYLLYDKKFGEAYDKAPDRVNISGNDWFPGFQISNDAKCYLWVKEANGMTLKKFNNVAQFRNEIQKNRADAQVLAKILNNEEVIYFVSEVYVDMDN